MLVCQKLYRFINCVELVSPHHAARELVHTLRQGQITSLFQKSVKRVSFCFLVFCHSLERKKTYHTWIIQIVSGHDTSSSCAQEILVVVYCHLWLSLRQSWNILLAKKTLLVLLPVIKYAMPFLIENSESDVELVPSYIVKSQNILNAFNIWSFIIMNLFSSGNERFLTTVDITF